SPRNHRRQCPKTLPHHAFARSRLACSVHRIVEHGKAPQVWEHFVKDRYPLARKLCGNASDPGCVASRSSKAYDEAGCDSVAGEHHDRNCSRRGLYGRDRLVAESKDHVRLAFHEILRVWYEAFVPTLREAEIKRGGVSIHIAVFVHLFHED